MFSLEAFLLVLCFLALSLGFMLLGLFVANLLTELGIDRKISSPFSVLMRVANLPPDLSLAIPFALMDVRAEQGYIVALREQGLSDTAITVYNLFRRPFTWVLHLYRYYIPIVLPALEPYTGSLYIATSFIPIAISTAVAIAYGRLHLSVARTSSH